MPRPRRAPGVAVAALAVMTLAACTNNPVAPPTSSATAAATAQGSPPSNAPELEKNYVSVVAQVLPSVVQITTGSGLGSGVILDDKGDIVTNAHVVGTPTTFQVRVANNPTAFAATLVGAYPPDDLAVIRLDQPPTGLKPARFGDSSKLQIGDIVLAMGNPLGLTGSVTDGIVSAVGRAVTEPAGDGSPGATLWGSKTRPWRLTSGFRLPSRTR
jgi:putative serine protease PepD